LRHVPGGDDATPEDIARRPWKETWPRYIRLHHAEFVAGATLFDNPEEAEDGEGSEDADAHDADSGSGGKGNKVKRKAWNQRRGKTLGLEAPSGRPMPLIDQAHRLMHLWRAGDEAKVDDYLDTRGLKRNAPFTQLLQALIELAAAGCEERSILESLSNHIASRGGVSVPRQGRLDHREVS
jgi:hypothetical protein